MPVIRADQAAVHKMHGTSFTAYASPDRGSQELCAWRIEIPGHTKGIPHHVASRAGMPVRQACQDLSQRSGDPAP